MLPLHRKETLFVKCYVLISVMIKGLLLLYPPKRLIFLNPVWFMKKTEKVFKSSQFAFRENTSAVKDSLLLFTFYSKNFVLYFDSKQR